MLAQSSDFVVCAGKGFTLSSTAVGTQPVTYQWFENGAAIDNSDNALLSVHEGKAAGTYAYVCKASSEACSDPLPSNTYTVEVLALPATPTITAPTAVCQGTDVVFGVANPVAGATYTWSGNAGGTASGTGNRTCTVSGATTGDKQVTVYVSEAAKGVTCRSADASPMTAAVVLQPPRPDIQRTTSNPTAACVNNNFIVTNPNSLCNYEWSTNYTIVAVSNDQTSCTVTTHGPGDVLRVQVKAIATAAGLTCSSTYSAISTAQEILEDGASANCAEACRNDYGENTCWHVYRDGYQLLDDVSASWEKCKAKCAAFGKPIIYSTAYLWNAWDIRHYTLWTNDAYLCYKDYSLQNCSDSNILECWCQNP